jgi:hypothetical protein
MMNLKEQLNYLRKKAHERGLKIRKDRRLIKTPYIAMHPYAGRELKQPFIKKHITYQPDLERRKRKLVMDVNHELIEYDLMKKGWKYKKAHKLANRKQRTLI